MLGETEPGEEEKSEEGGAGRGDSNPIPHATPPG
jgi:hypothetical protein